MDNRKESLKKSLGITEYPWSSDDDNDPQASTQVSVNQPDMDDVTGTLVSTSRGTRRGHARVDRSSFWPVWSEPNPGPSTFTQRTRSEMSSAQTSRPTQTPCYRPASYTAPPTSYSTPAADMQRIMAYRRINRSLNEYRAGRSGTNLFMPRRDIYAVPSSALPTEVAAMIRARARKAHIRIAVPESTNGNGALLNGNDELEASTSGIPRHAPPPPPAREPVTAEPVDLDHSDDDVEMSAVDVSGESAARDNADGNGGSHTAEVSLEEIVEIDAEPEPSVNDSVQEVPAGPSNEANPNTSGDAVTVTGVKRKRDALDDPETVTVQEFNQNLLRLLECPVCLDWMEPPMAQCRRGHLVCGRCRARLATCPVCRTSFSSVRNRAMEQVAEMLRYPCRHGCGREVRLRRRTPHEASCASRRYRCVAPACDTQPLPHRELPHHFQSKHMSLLKMGRKHTFSMKVSSEQHDNFVIMALRELFHLRVDVDIRTWGVVAYVAYIGPKCYAPNFNYEVTVIGNNNARKLVYTRATHCDLECSSLNMSRQDCFHMTIDQALNFVRMKSRNASTEQDRYLNFIVEITKNEVEVARQDSD